MEAAVIIQAVGVRCAARYTARMLHVVLFQPEIPPNTGNVIRLCANTGSRLHLIGPLGFDMDDRRLRRAGLDYREWASVSVHPSLASFKRDIRPERTWAVSTRGARCYSDVRYRHGDALLFGPETRGYWSLVPTWGHPRLSLRNSVRVFRLWTSMGPMWNLPD